MLLRHHRQSVPGLADGDYDWLVLLLLKHSQYHVIPMKTISGLVLSHVLDGDSSEDDDNILGKLGKPMNSLRRGSSDKFYLQGSKILLQCHKYVNDCLHQPCNNGGWRDRKSVV